MSVFIVFNLRVIIVLIYCKVLTFSEDQDMYFPSQNVFICIKMKKKLLLRVRSVKIVVQNFEFGNLTTDHHFEFLSPDADKN